MSLKIVLCHFCEAHGPRILFCTEIKSQAQFNLHTSSKSDIVKQGGAACTACTSVSDHLGFISREVNPLTNDSPDQEQTCFEQCIYKSSQCPDSADDFSHIRQACVKSLSNEVGMSQKSCIFFGDSKNGYTLSQVFNLHDSKARGLQRLYSLLAWSRDRYFLVNYWAFFENNFRIVVRGLVNRAEQLFQSENKQELMPNKHFQRTRTVTARSLPALVNCEDVFEKLHQQFTWILKNSFSYFVELEPPDWLRVLDEDVEVAKEVSKDLLNDDFVCSTMEASQDCPIGTASILLPLRALHQLLGGNYFIIMCLHTLIGNQVVVRGSNQEFVTAILNTFAKLLPLGCCRMKTSAESYFEAFEYNLLGIVRSVQLPRHVEESDLFVLLDVLGDGSEVSRYSFEVTSNLFFVRDDMPSILRNLEKTITNSQDFSSSEVISYYLCLKEELMGKVETFYQFAKLSDHWSSKSKLQAVFKMLDAKNEMEQMMLKFWTNGLSSKFKKDQLRLLKEFEL